jgi:hypothetical protein
MSSSLFTSKQLGQLSKKYTDSSVKTIEGGIRRVLHNAFDSSSSTIDNLLNYPLIYTYLEKCNKTSVKKSLVYNIITALNVIDNVPSDILDKYTMLFTRYSKTHNETYKDKSASDDMINKYKTMENLYNMHKDIEKRIKNTDYTVHTESLCNVKQKDILKYIITALYVYMPALRGQEYYETVIYNLPSNTNYSYYNDLINDNYYNEDSGELIIKNHKTVNKYGYKITKFPKIIIDIIKKNHYQLYQSCDIDQTRDNEQTCDNNQSRDNDKIYLLTLNNKPIKQTTFTYLLNQYFGLSIDMLRKIYISEMLYHIDQRSDITKDDKLKYRNKVSSIMGHSLETQSFCYKKFDDNNIQHSSYTHMDMLFNILKYM